jgi:glutamate decarboxylase
LPEDLIFKVNYLGGEMPTFAINFSRPGNQIIAQYYAFLRLGRSGYADVQNACREVASYLAEGFEKAGPFVALSRGEDLPVIALKLKDDPNRTWTVFDVSRELRAFGWQVPAYTFPEDLTEMAVLRVAVRHGMSADLADLLLENLIKVISDLEKFGGRTTDSQQPSTFHH